MGEIGVLDTASLKYVCLIVLRGARWTLANGMWSMYQVGSDSVL